MDLNTASFALLRYVAGINERTALKIVEHRDQAGAFRTRAELLGVSGFGPKTSSRRPVFWHSRRRQPPLDMTAVHPESHPVVEAIAASLGVSVKELIANPQFIDKVKIEEFASATVGMYTLGDIREELRKPGRDPRDKFVATGVRRCQRTEVGHVS